MDSEKEEGKVDDSRNTKENDNSRNMMIPETQKRITTDF